MYPLEVLYEMFKIIPNTNSNTEVKICSKQHGIAGKNKEENSEDKYYHAIKITKKTNEIFEFSSWCKMKALMDECVGVGYEYKVMEIKPFNPSMDTAHCMQGGQSEDDDAGTFSYKNGVLEYKVNKSIANAKKFFKRYKNHILSNSEQSPPFGQFSAHLKTVDDHDYPSYIRTLFIEAGPAVLDFNNDGLLDHQLNTKENPNLGLLKIDVTDSRDLSDSEKSAPFDIQNDSDDTIIFEYNSIVRYSLLAIKQAWKSSGTINYGQTMLYELDNSKDNEYYEPAAPFECSSSPAYKGCYGSNKTCQTYDIEASIIPTFKIENIVEENYICKKVEDEMIHISQQKVSITDDNHIWIKEHTYDVKKEFTNDYKENKSEKTKKE